MGEFFTPWRRKAGCVTLVMACVFMAAWLRSLTTRDQITFGRVDALQAIGSASGTFRWAGLRPPLEAGSPFEWKTAAASKDDDHDHYWKQWGQGMGRMWTLHWRWGWAGFDFGAGTSQSNAGTHHVERWSVPYWFLSSVPILLSAYLLLRKPRHTVPKQTT
jgi:hypothetical protein